MARGWGVGKGSGISRQGSGVVAAARRDWLWAEGGTPSAPCESGALIRPVAQSPIPNAPKTAAPRGGVPRGVRLRLGAAGKPGSVLARGFPLPYDGGSAGPSGLGRPFLCRTPLPTPGGLSPPAPDPTPRSPDRGRGPLRTRGSLLGLARGGVYRAPAVTSRAVRSYRTLSPLPDPGRAPAIGGLLSVALSLALSRTLSGVSGGWA
jgi:hypothetical protein